MPIIRAAGSAPRSALQKVAVYDGVLSAACAQAVAQEETTIYRRLSFGSRASRSARNSVVESILRPLQENSREVEVWGRESWQSMPVHRDADEPAAAMGVVRHPRTVCILYLDVDEHEAAPTMLWMTPDADSGQEAGSDFDGVAMVVVPAVAGRMVVFSGETLHAVPRPATQFLGDTDPTPCATRDRNVLSECHPI